MDPVRLDLSRAPRKGRVALSAPHLVAPINLEDGCGALRAVARVLRHELGSGDVGRVARVSRVSVQTLDLVAVGAGPDFTQAALPGCAEKARAVGRGTGPDELALCPGGHARPSVRPTALGKHVVADVALIGSYHLGFLHHQTVPNNLSLQVVRETVFDCQWPERKGVNGRGLLSDILYFFVYFLNLFGVETHLDLSLHIGLGLWHETPLALK
jgi:hypothetical protein